MKIAYRISADDYVEAQRAHCSSKPSWRWRMRMGIGFGVLFLIGQISLLIFVPEMRNARFRPNHNPSQSPPAWCCQQTPRSSAAQNAAQADNLAAAWAYQ